MKKIGLFLASTISTSVTLILLAGEYHVAYFIGACVSIFLMIKFIQ